MPVDTTSVPTLIANASHAVVASENEAVATTRNAAAVPMVSHEANLMLMLMLLPFCGLRWGHRPRVARAAGAMQSGRPPGLVVRESRRPGMPRDSAASRTNANSASQLIDAMCLSCAPPARPPSCETSRHLPPTVSPMWTHLNGSGRASQHALTFARSLRPIGGTTALAASIDRSIDRVCLLPTA